MCKKILVVLLWLLPAAVVVCQEAAIQRIDPANWWVGMKNRNLQLLVYGPNAGQLTYTINYPGVQLVRTHKVANPNYAFLDLNIAANARPGRVQVTGKQGGTTLRHAFTLMARNKQPKGTGVTTADFVYLLMPDRFANGDPSNDKFPNMLDTAADARNPVLRHGGDLKGITDHLDYLKDLGVTAVWPTPVITNDELLKKEGHGMMQAGYHGYHFTDFYQVDPRFGGNKGYREFSDALHKNGMKLVQDAVYNHVSDDHWMFKDPPTNDWFNNWPQTTITTHKEQVLYDPHASHHDEEKFIRGWFTPFLPDLNQQNPYLATYLIQNAIWYTEMFAVDAWRIDTYKYNDQAFMNRCNQALMKEYPNIHLFGETMVGDPLNLSYYVKNKVDYPFKSNLPGTLDFPVNYAILDALNQQYGWGEGVNRLYDVLAKDVLYANPMKNVTSLDNHDMDRYLSVIGEDLKKYQMGLTWLLTLRGIPSIYYGTEILMKNYRNPHDAYVRENFPGGFPGDAVNKFTAAGRTAQENEAYNFIKKLANYRRNMPALHAGKMMQFLPDDGVYVYFRYDDKRTVMVASNSNNSDKTIATSRYAERMKGYRGAVNVITGEVLQDISNLALPAKTAVVLELLQ